MVLPNQSQDACIDMKKESLPHEEILQQESGLGSIIDESAEKSLRRKIDWKLLPFLCGIYFLQYLDKTLAGHNLMGLRDDTNTSTNQFAWLGTVFYLAYLVSEPPTNYLLQRFRLARYLGINIILWGIVTAAHAAAQNFATLCALRFLLGMLEACVAPSLILITGMWWTKPEASRRLGVWYLQIGIAQIVGACVSYGFQHINHSSLANWRILFLTFGLITSIVGLIVVLFLPDNPSSATWLSESERVAAIDHVRVNMTGIECKEFKAYQVKQCLLTPQTWLLVLITLFSMVDNGAVSNFSSIIIKTFGYSNEKTTILQIPSGVVSIIATFFATFMVGWVGQRALFIGIVCLPSVLGAGLLLGLNKNHKVGQLFGVYLLNSAPACLPIIYGWASANTAGHTKKVTLNALILMAFSIGNIIGPQIFQSEDAPSYTPAKIALIITLAGAAGTSFVLRSFTIRVNRKRVAEGHKTMEGEQFGFEDVTDGDNPAFRYVY